MAARTLPAAPDGATTARSCPTCARGPVKGVPVLARATSRDRGRIRVAGVAPSVPGRRRLRPRTDQATPAGAIRPRSCPRWFGRSRFSPDVPFDERSAELRPDLEQKWQDFARLSNGIALA
jgi:hypothetical protein